jgi:transcription elongation GreA/GreB family factor
MSRAFVREADTDASIAELPERPQSPHPNFVTPAGLAQLEARLAGQERLRQELLETGDDLARELPLAQAEREIRYLKGRIEAADVVDPARQPGDRVAFGARVEVLDEDGRRLAYTIVGEDEAEAEHGKVSWISPLARALMDARVGDMVTWRRPSGDAELEVVGIGYG